MLTVLHRIALYQVQTTSPSDAKSLLDSWSHFGASSQPAVADPPHNPTQTTFQGAVVQSAVVWIDRKLEISRVIASASSSE
jgi:hypothetical protein